MKVFLRLSWALMLLFSATVAQAATETARSTPIERVISKRALVVTWGQFSEKYLLYLGNGCGTLTEGQRVSISARNQLDGGDNDTVQVDAYRRCAIVRADLFDTELTVTTVFQSSNRVVVIDPNGLEQTLFFDARCHAIRGYQGERLYALTGGSIDPGDRLYLPNNDGFCSITYVQPALVEPAETPRGDVTRPSVVGNVKAVAENGRVFLSWRAAQDNVAVSHYLISVSDGKINTRSELSADAMPNVTRTTETKAVLDGLNNDETHFIYLAAVDTSGNLSAHWTEVIAFPRSGTFRSGSATVEGIGLQIAEQNDRFIRLSWAKPVGDFNYQLTLRSGEKLIWKEDFSKRSTLQLVNRSAYSGLPMTLTVTRYNHYGFVDRQIISFQFD
ncbi:fibronectin type III domain-containing protein [Candidatus Peregrinibacteria bacterium]|nr:MAG: fibronectin type III domain-containing protein [Candidatus Peregrinibacteria bacterium]